MNTSSNFSALLQAYFTERLMEQRNASQHTIASYRDTFRLLIAFAERSLKKPPNRLAVEDLDAPFILRFLNSLEKQRNNSPRTRNCRLASIHSFFEYVALQEPTLGVVSQRVLAIQGKRYVKKPVAFLTRAEVNALLDAPDIRTWGGRRDHALLLLAVETGLRVSELISLCWRDVVFGPGAHVTCTGKGRKMRSVPLRRETAAAMHAWRKEQHGQPDEPVFPNARRRSLSRDGVEYLLSEHTKTASAKCPSLKKKRLSPHVLRHTTAMNLLQHGVDCSVIALWLGHESMETTQIYLHANLALTEQALAKTVAFKGRTSRYRPPDPLRKFLESL